MIKNIYKSLFISTTVGTVLGTQVLSPLPTSSNTAIVAYRIASPAFVTVDQGSAMGSGSVISPDGYIITNAHVVNSGSATVTWLNGRSATGQVIARNNDVDLALIKLQGVSNLPYLKLSTATPLVGQDVYAIGSPFGEFKGAMSRGIISRVSRDKIQSDAAINSGNSGGPLINDRGEQVAVNASIFTGSPKDEGFVGLGFSIPIPIVQRFLASNNVRAQYVSTPITQMALVPNAPVTPVTQQGPQVTPPVQAIQSRPTVPRVLAFGGALKQGDRVSGNKYYDLYRFVAGQGQTLTFSMGSRYFWGKLGVMNSSGQMLALNGDGKSNPSVNVKVPISGTYYLVASSYTPSQGDYQIVGGVSQTVSYNKVSYKTSYRAPNQPWYAKLLGLFRTSHK